MSSGVERFTRAARASGLSPQVRRFPQGTRTATDAARAVGCDIGQIVKSLVFVADGRPVVALTSGSNRASPDRLRAVLGAGQVRRATPEEARDATGFAIGGTPPLGYPGPVAVLIDPHLLGHDVLWAAAGAPDAVFAVTPNDLLRCAGGKVADFSER